MCLLTEEYAAHMLSGMDVRTDIVEMERRLAEGGLSVAKLCRRAGINQTTWVRWKSGTPARETTWARIKAAFAALMESSAAAEEAA